MTIEHAKKQANLAELSYLQMEKRIAWLIFSRMGSWFFILLLISVYDR
jgi:hypothetical protein